jgi:hypothetical protein
LLFNRVAMLGFAIVILVPTWEAVLVGVVVFLSRSATLAFCTAFPLLLVYCRSFEWLVVAFAVRGFKEFGEPAPVLSRPR